MPSHQKKKSPRHGYGQVPNTLLVKIFCDSLVKKHVYCYYLRLSLTIFFFYIVESKSFHNLLWHLHDSD